VDPCKNYEIENFLFCGIMSSQSETGTSDNNG